MKIAVVGTGYVGLVSGACMAETGINVVCVDVDERKINQLLEGEIPIYEPGLKDVVVNNAKKGRLQFSTSLKDNLEGCDAVFIAVGTPPDEDGSADLQYVLAVAEEIGRNMNDYMVIVTKSTVPVGTCQKVKVAVGSELVRRGVQIEFDVASNPEFLKEGSAVKDFLYPDRIVIGVESERAQKIMERMYKPFVLNGHPILFMDLFSSEMTKYAANAMLATKISFMNDIANLCELVGADVNDVRRGIGSDPRIGNKFIYPGTGYGGSCFPKDVKALVKTGIENGHHLEILEAVESVNDRQKSILVRKAKEHYGDDLSGKVFCLWGLSFKPKTDDMREAPALVIIEQLLEAGATVKAYDPVAMEEAERIVGDKITLTTNEYEAAEGVDGLMLVTEWSDFRSPDFELIGSKMKEKVIFDGRNIYDPEDMIELGYKYYSIGRRSM
ncbi:UDP-glucose/GDP-mannose dehydrogenase family protein [Puteibacter caeruleilacunae]|nr:UDP-glucose/GDP-mannose dehydrogenase family protein [Puteibacter caeruleilacunae]